MNPSAYIREAERHKNEPPRQELMMYSLFKQIFFKPLRSILYSGNDLSVIVQQLCICLVDGIRLAK
jgi:hypothetical protein